MSEIPYSESFVNFQKLIENDPKELDRLKKVMAGAVRLRNTMTVREFEKYNIIFKLNGRDIMGDEEYDLLCKEYFNRISSYHPVHIVNDEGEEVLTLPAVFNMVSAVSDIGIDGSQAIDAFTNAQTSADEFNTRKRAYTSHLSKVFEAAQDIDSLNANKEYNNKLVEDLKRQQIVGANNTDEIRQFIPEEIDSLDKELTDNVEYL